MNDSSSASKQGRAPRPISLIVVHCSATPQDMDVGAAEIRSWHLRRGWSDIGYHYVIRRDGALEPGRPVDRAGAHVKGHNARSIGVCLVGGNDADDRARAEFNFTRAQLATLERTLVGLLALYPDARVVGHRDLDPRKACPCFDVAAWWAG